MEAVRWTLDELAVRVGAALSGAARTGTYPGPPNGRVREAPDRRAIRWYTTIGLVDRPLAMRGRTALYGPRHLRQLVAIKRRQAEGLSLAEIQAELVGAGDAQLAAASGIQDTSALLRADGSTDPDTVTVPGGAVSPAGQEPASGGDPVRRFWSTPPTTAPATAQISPAPAPAAPSATVPQPYPQPYPRPPAAPQPPAVPHPQPQPPAVPEPEPGAPGGPGVLPPGVIGSVPGVRILAQPPGVLPGPHAVTTLTGLLLADGVTLLLPTTPTPTDLAAVLAAAQPLVDLLTARGLTGPAQLRSL